MLFSPIPNEYPYRSSDFWRPRAIGLQESVCEDDELDRRLKLLTRACRSAGQNSDNARYLTAKATRAGHQLDYLVGSLAKLTHETEPNSILKRALETSASLRVR